MRHRTERNMSTAHASYLKSQERSGRMEKKIPARDGIDFNSPESTNKPSLCPIRLNTLWTSGATLSEESVDVTVSRSSVVSSAASKRHFYFFSRKHTKSLTSPEPDKNKSEILKLHRQFSHDIAMQNNCTVISNKVGPVVIKNCKEEFQMRQIKNKATGKLHETSTEHELLLDKYFLLKDHFVGIDRHDTLEKHGVPNMRKRFGSPTLYAVGQPTMNGLRKLTSALLQNHKLVYYVNVRSVPTLFLRRSDDFLPYSAYCCPGYGQQKIDLTERELHDAEREIQCQALAIASTNSDATFYYYNVLDPSPDEPHMYKTTCMEDLVTSRQIFAKILVEHKNFKYKRLPLNTLSKPSPQWIDSLMEILKDANVFHNEDAAIVFQGLTGEANACLAMILTSLTLSPTVSEKIMKKQIQVRSLQERCFWRESIIRNIMESSKLDGTPRYEVDAVIASVIHGSLLENVAKEARREHQREGGVLQGELAKDFNEQNGEDMDHQQMEKQLSCDSNTSSCLTLRDVSELSLPSHYRRKEPRPCSVVRYEATDEESLIKGLLINTDLYALILIYRNYVNEQRLCNFHKTFSKWLNHHPRFIFDLAQTRQYNNSVDFTIPLQLTAKSVDTSDYLPGPSYHRVVGFPCFGMEQSLPKRFAEVVKKLCHDGHKVSYNGVVFINCREELTFYTSSGQVEPSSDASDPNCINAQWELKVESIPYLHGATAALLEDTERKLANFMKKEPENVFLIHEEEQGDVSPGSFTTVKAALEDIGNDDSVKNVCSSLQYTRIPLPRHRIPKFEIFDKVIEIVRDSYETDPKRAFIFFCHNGKRRTVNMMAVACLVLSHMKGFSEDIGSLLGDRFEPWVPDAEYTRGEFEVVIELMQILPDCNLRKKEVDYILDMIHESMSTMHYHPRENLNPCFKKIKRAKCFEEFLRLKQQSFQNLEFYTILIVLNCYLNQEKKDLWRSLSFDDWIDKHASQVGVLDVLDNFGFQSLGEDAPLNRMLGRWQATSSLIRDITYIDEMSYFSPRQRVTSGSLGADMSSTTSLVGCTEAESI